MAIILLAIGAILSAVGLYALVSGYPIIEIERGWASVIAGSVLLSGGLVIVALGLVLRALTRMRTAPPMTAPAAATPAAAMTEPSFAPVAPAPRVAAPLDAAAPALAVAAPAAVLAADYGAPPAPLASVAPPEPRVPVHEEPESQAAAPPVEPADGWDAPAFSAFDYGAEPEAHVPPAETPHVEPAPAPPPPKGDHVAPIDHEFAEPAAPLPEAEQTDAHAPSPDDLSHLESPLQHEEHEPGTDAGSVEHAHPVEHADEPTLASQVEHSAEPIADAPATAPDAPPANLSVIGRYDSEGTSYVMYSDGSIEAQSEAGIYRFGSMAELKAFIEG